MTIINFTPWTALIGGACIGAGALLLMLVAGKTAGISGIVSGIATQADKSWRLAFVVGLVLVPAVLFATDQVAVPELASQSVVKLVLAGLLVGIGTRLGNGCTSGHGICGIGRFSWRSLVATGIFMAAGIATVSALGWGA
ncbi:YeeE/YedE family protein [Oceanisphaera pacifica]|uniref:YeeE/YedE family protein n=1 Tax=Oceanisphaera pacifica TaxID=2818389 RepID=A0ABS3NEP5_9GAMM|nr:YeeE/YedE thiosulfate transporter family protein [Oceanisphaera pacifica]MBO1519052.1 YeeE/YedE family protein [Oceanisphaera pacifica]